jgi:hypothetical protein
VDSALSTYASAAATGGNEAYIALSWARLESRQHWPGAAGRARAIFEAAAQEHPEDHRLLQAWGVMEMRFAHSDDER